MNFAPPVVNAGVDQLVDEGDLVSFDGTFTDVDPLDTHVITWDLGDGSTFVETAPAQWAVADGGNDHWYQVVAVPGGITWADANVATTAAGGYLATLTSDVENQFVFDLADHLELWAVPYSSDVGPWLGGFQTSGASAPDADWQWVSGETWDFTSWGIGEPNDSGGVQDRLHFFVGVGEPYEAVWNDVQSTYAHTPSYVVEWDSFAGNPLSSAPSHVYEDDGDYTVTMTVEDDGGESSSDTLTVTVNNVAPVVEAGPDQTVNEGDVVDFSGSFTDAGSADTHVRVWEFGDGSIHAETTPAQWSVADGGNDHWYQVVSVGLDGLTWDDAKLAAESVGGYLATPTSMPENDFVFSQFSNKEVFWRSNATTDYYMGPWLGGYQDPPDSTPSNANWFWVTDETWSFTNWIGNNPDDGHGPQDKLQFLYDQGEWNDQSNDGYYYGKSISYVIEWDSHAGEPNSSTPSHVYADDGVYTVTLTVTDDDGGASSDTLTVTVNNVAPIVEAGPDQTVKEGDVVDFSGSFTDAGSADTHLLTWDFGDGTTEINTTPTQWTSVNSGNDHWYQVVAVPEGILWEEASDAATSAGGYLATLTSAGENQFAFDLAGFPEFWTSPFAGDVGPWIGGIQDSGASAPDAGWQWVTGETWDFSSWGIGEPNDSQGAVQDRVHFYVGSNEPYEAVWNDIQSSYVLSSYTVEWDSYSGDPNTSTPSHVYADDGVYTVTMTVTDDDGGSSSDTLTVTVDIGYDFGDAPATFPTLLADDGARHYADGPTLGAARDAEPDGLPNPSATGDDISAIPTDEDGIVIPPLLAPGRINVLAEVTASGNSYLNAWIDFNVNGTWESSEQVAIDVPLVAGLNLVPVDVPLDAVPGLTFARLRLTSYDTGETLTPSGLASDGEVEDYILIIQDDIYLEGTSGDDVISVTPGTPGGAFHQVNINGVVRSYDASVYSAIHVDGLAGNDQLTIHGKPTDETVMFDGKSAHMLEDSVYDVYDVYGQGFEKIFANSNGGDDGAVMLGSPQDDRFYARTGYSYMRASDWSYFNQASGFVGTTAEVTSSGGSDVAYLYDSDGNDMLHAFSNLSTMVLLPAAGGAVVYTASGFRSVNVNAANGGTDSAMLTGSGLGDRFYGRADYSYMRATNSSYNNYTSGFDSITANGGGLDNIAYLYDTDGDDSLTAAPGTVSIILNPTSGDPVENIVNGFSVLYSYAIHGGNDFATLIGSPEVDRFFGRNGYSYMRANDNSYFNYAHGYDGVLANGIGDGDIAYLYDSDGDDVLTALPGSAAMTLNPIGGDVSTKTTVNFDILYAYSTEGGGDAATLNGSVDTSDKYYYKPTHSYMKDSTASYINYVRGFVRVNANADGPDDKAFLYDGSSDDLLVLAPNYASFTLSLGAEGTLATWAINFKEVYAYATEGGTDQVILNSSPGVDRYYGLPTYGYIRADDSPIHDPYYGYVRGFDIYDINASQEDFAYLYGSDGNDVLNADPHYVAFTLNPTSGGQVVHTAMGFGQAYSYATGGGTDQAYLNGTTSPDTFVGDTDWGYLRSTRSSDYLNYVRYFDEVFADPGDTDVGNDLLDDRGATYVLDSDPGNGNAW